MSVGQDLVDDHGCISHLLGSLLEVNGQPAIRLNDLSQVKLVPAAAACQYFEDQGKKEIMLVADGLAATAVRLTWTDDERVIELLQLAKTILKKRS